MYERFTEHARTVMQIAAQEAKRLQYDYLGTEHVLIGLVSEDGGMAAKVLKSLDVDVEMIRRDVENLALNPPDVFASIARLSIDVNEIASKDEIEQFKKMYAERRRDILASGNLPLAPRVKSVIEHSLEEAITLRHNIVSTGHILVGLLREQEGVACQILMNHGLTLQAVRDKIRAISQETEHET